MIDFKSQSKKAGDIRSFFGSKQAVPKSEGVRVQDTNVTANNANTTASPIKGKDDSKRIASAKKQPAPAEPKSAPASKVAIQVTPSSQTVVVSSPATSMKKKSNKDRAAASSPAASAKKSNKDQAAASPASAKKPAVTALVSSRKRSSKRAQVISSSEEEDVHDDDDEDEDFSVEEIVDSDGEASADMESEEGLQDCVMVDEEEDNSSKKKKINKSSGSSGSERATKKIKTDVDMASKTIGQQSNKSNKNVAMESKEGSVPAIGTVDKLEKELDRHTLPLSTISTAQKKSGRVLPASLAAAARTAAPAAASSAPSPGLKKVPATIAAAAAAAPANKRAAAAQAAAPALDATARQAIQAVDEAVKKLPPESEVKYSLPAEGTDAAGNDGIPPPLHGQKDLPRGHPDCLSGKTFVITGILESLYREEAEDAIKRHGGRVTGAVSGKTTFLLAGSNCGRSKHRAAQEKGTRIIDEDGLFSLISASIPFVINQNRGAAVKELSPVVTARLGSIEAPTTIKNNDNHTTLNIQRRAAGSSCSPAAGTAARKPANQDASSAKLSAPLPSLTGGSFFGATDVRASAKGLTAATTATAAAAASSASHYGHTESLLWVDKHKPKSSVELTGNNGLVASLRAWLSQWSAIHLHGKQPVAYSGSGSGKPKDLHKKAVLLSGPPGIGKTSAAHIIARECGFEVVEVNASDSRSKSDSKITDGIGGKSSNMVKEMTTNETMFSCKGMVSHAGPAGLKKQLLVMDEVDGMSGGDRGGVQDLIDSIKKSKIPIIAICNDKYHQKLKSLRNHCLELDFKRPTSLQVSKRMQEVCAKEGLRINDSTMTALVEGACGDLRLILGQLQMVRRSRTSLTYDDVKGKQGAAKDADLSPFDVSRRLFEPSMATCSINDQLDLVFADSDLVPLLIQENYVNHRPVIAGNDEQRMRALAKAAESISSGDVINSALRRSNNWSLGPAALTLMGIVPATYMRGPRELLGLPNGNEMNFPRFTAWLGNYSSSNKQRRLLGEVTTTMGSSGHMPSHRSVVRTEYLSALRTLLTQPLRQIGSTASGAAAGAAAAPSQEAAITTLLELMDSYCISREQFDYVVDVTSFKTKATWGEDPMKDVETKVKSAFTRRFNQMGHVARCGLMLEEPKKGRGGKGRGKAAGTADAGEDEDLEIGELQEGEEALPASGQQQESEEGEDDTADALMLQKKLAKKGVSLQLKSETKAGATKGGGSGAGKASSGRGAGGGSGSGVGGKNGNGGRGRGGNAASKK
ncbi:hypothetical protein CEUSTIGMA_g1902.t1 [Chlamydomonas eustigma]|uniref:Replication factor C subunit 1 n=1 Tax=Chlamydomonas eustigma TaxID=1157962 RepID=A0A250WUF0_9CHLO|nr:hypothetical protein CEUSTIGMA_g1902.t1 [Chlamydomonas eustigma]|eukprot:GAX74453.1 hypothetical protein CEUSTIGMA_g1902.t1 [Chlamydomonas eustigma]